MKRCWLRTKVLRISALNSPMDTVRHIKLRWLHGTLGDASVSSIQVWRSRAAYLAAAHQRFLLPNGGSLP
jgi:hypothetical protein